jgi:L-fucose isomerase-like protein
MDFSDEISACMVPAAFSGLPVLLFATEESPKVPLPTMTTQTSDSFCGTLSIASGLYRRKIPFLFYGVCNPEDFPFIEYVTSFVRTCAIVKNFKDAYIGQIGTRPSAFETCAIDEQILLSTFGIRTIPITSQRIFSMVDELKDDDPDVVKTITDIKNKADTSALSEEQLKRMAKIEVVMKGWAYQMKLVGLGVGFEVPPYIQGRLIDQGIMVGFEVDIMGCLTMLMHYSASLRTKFPYLIDWNLKHPEKKNIFLVWHVGNAPPSMAESEVRLDSEGMSHFKLKSGPVTFSRIVEYDGNFKMLISKGKLLSLGEEGDARYTWAWAEVEDLAKLYTTIGKEGFVHHASMIYDNYNHAIKDACFFLGIQVVEV